MSSTSKSERGPLLGALVRLTAHAMGLEYARWLASSGFDRIQPAHSAAIQPLWDLPDGARITTLARSARITKQSMSALIDQLESASYVERVPDPDDARATLVRLTPRGRSFARAVRAFAKSVETQWAEKLGAQRVADLKETLALVHDTFYAEDDR